MNTTTTDFKHVPVATPDVVNGQKLPEGITREMLDRAWQDHCHEIGFPLPKANNLPMPASRTDLVKYYTGRLVKQLGLEL